MTKDLLLEKKKKGSTIEIHEPSVSELAIIQWSKNHLGPEDELLTKWSETYYPRKNLLKGQNRLSVNGYFNKFPALKSNFGVELLKIDFKQQFPQQENVFYERWRIIVDYLTEYLTKPRQLASLDDAQLARRLSSLKVDFKILPILKLLPCVIRAERSRKRKANENDVAQLNTDAASDSTPKNRLTLQDRRDSFFLHIPNAAEINTLVGKHTRILKAAGLDFQPTPLFVGLLEAIDAAYVVVNDTQYKVNSALEAVNLCFQAFWALDCKYPERASSLWKFLQIGGYQIGLNDTKQQDIITMVSAIDLKASISHN